MGENCTWREKGDQSGSIEEERVDSTVKEDRFQGGEMGQARRVCQGEVEETMSG